jgi:ABC-type phosphate/phosphonate transport system substrate-binding protein
MSDKKLTAEQIEKIQEILNRYREETDKILEEHYAKVKQVLTEQDAKKMEELKQSINENT